MNSLLQGEEFGGVPVTNQEIGSLIGRSDELLSHVQELSTMSTPPAHDLCAS